MNFQNIQYPLSEFLHIPHVSQKKKKKKEDLLLTNEERINGVSKAASSRLVAKPRLTMEKSREDERPSVSNMKVEINGSSAEFVEEIFHFVKKDAQSSHRGNQQHQWNRRERRSKHHLQHFIYLFILCFGGERGRKEGRVLM
ncbi:hypothetical protein Ancab_024683 [Ancistrocladus abbreviatus]